MSVKLSDAHRQAHRRLQEVAGRQYASREERQAAIVAVKAEELGRFVAPGLRIAFGRYDVEFVRWGYLGQSVEVLARVWRDGRQLGFGPAGMIDIERFRFNRLQMFIEHSDGDIVRSWKNHRGQSFERVLKFDPRAGLLNAITQAAEHSGKDSGLIVPDTIGSTTYTLFPPAGGSGQIASQGTTVYSTMRSGNALSADTSVVFIGQDKSGTNFDGSEGLIAFDTSGVVGTITAATLSLYTNDTSSMSNTWTLNARDVASPLSNAWSDIPTISTSDWIAGASVSAQALMASVSVTTSTPQGAYLALTSQAAFNDGTRINQSGYTGLMLSGSRFEAGTTPTALESLGFDSDSTNTVAGTGSDPKLVVVATAPTAAGGFFMFL